MEEKEKLTGLQVAQFYCAAKAHYLGSYDILKYRWKFKQMDEEAFRAHKNRFVFERLAREYYYEAHFKRALGYVLYEKPKAHIRDLMRGKLNVETSIRRMEFLYDNFQFNFERFGTDSAKWWDALIENRCTPESAAIFWDLYVGKPIESPIRRLNLLGKYAAFIAYDKAKVAFIINQCHTKA